MPDAIKPPVTIRFRKMNIPAETKQLGVERDRNAERVEFVLPRKYQGVDMGSKEFFVDTMNGAGELFDAAGPQKTVTDDEIRLLWIVGPLPASASGKVKVRLRAISQDFIWQTETGEFDLAPTFTSPSDPPDPPGQSYFDFMLLQVALLRDQAALSASAAGQSAAGAQQEASRAEAAAGGMASKFAFYADGAGVKITAATGSKMRVTTTHTTTVAINGVAMSFAAGVAQDIDASPGVTTLAAASGALSVGYNRDSIAVLEALTAPASDTGAIAQVHPVDGLPLDVTARLIAAQEGSGEPSPENVRPIAGKSAVDITRAGKNLLPSTNRTFTVSGVAFVLTADGKLTANGTPTANISSGLLGSYESVTPLFWLPPGTYTLTNVSNAVQIHVGRTNETLFSVSNPTRTLSVLTPITFINVVIRTDAGAVTNQAVYLQLEQGPAVTPFESYAGKAYPVALPETLYGLPSAEDEVRSDGTVRKRTAIQSYIGDASEGWLRSAVYDSSDMYCFRAGQQDNTLQAANALAISTHFRQIVNGWQASINQSNISLSGLGYKFFKVPKTLIQGNNDAELLSAWRAWLAARHAAGTPVQILYELATPQMASMDRITIPALAGPNNVFNDGGGDTTAAGRLSPQHANDRVSARLAALEALVTTP